MNIDKNFEYERLLGNQPLIYIYEKDELSANIQLKVVKLFCKYNNLKNYKVYMDFGKKNSLNNKTNLKKLINENRDNNILVMDCSRFTRNVLELLGLIKLFQNKKLNIFDISSKQFIFNKDFEGIENQLFKGSDENMQRKLDILFVEPNKLPIKMTIKNTLEAKQELVGGYIEYTYLENCDDVVIICNEEGKILGLPYNRDIGHDIIAGNFIIVGDDPEFGEDRSLTQKQIEKYSEYFGENSISDIKLKIKDLSNKNNLDL